MSDAHAEETREAAAAESAQPPRLMSLDEVVSISPLRRAWRRTVRNGLRRQALRDLHDYLDVHRNLEPLLERLRTEVLGGYYRTSEPEIITIEKKLGVSRRMLIPPPSEAILLQTLVDAIETAVEAAQPCDSAYYSRSHEFPSVTSFEANFGYPWWVLWPRFQAEIHRFTKTHPFLVTTDISNYFDSIPLSKLRNSLAPFAGLSEKGLNFLFFLLEGFLLRPDYVPASSVGLPTIDFDAPRLLAHAFLFPIDSYLAAAAPGAYVRWMDDIDFGIASEEQGRELLHELDERLLRLGVRINTGKTRILDGEEATEYFWIKHNGRLTILSNLVRNNASPGNVVAKVRAELARRYLSEFLGQDKQGQWRKVVKRFLKLFGELGLDDVLPQCPQLLRDEPEVRDAVCRYLYALGYSVERASIVSEFLRSGGAVDDAVFVVAAQLFVDWSVPLDEDVGEFVLLGFELADSCLASQSRGRFTAGLWLILKYGGREELIEFVIRTQRFWKRSGWAARQIAATTPLLANAGKDVVRDIERTGNGAAVGVLNSLNEILGCSELDGQLQSYLYDVPAHGRPYALPKFVLSASLLGPSSSLDDKHRFLERVLSACPDPLYKKALEAMLNTA